MIWESSATVAIDAPPGVVWNVLLDGRRWNSWTPGVEWMVLEGDAAPGNRLTLKPKGAPQTAFTLEDVVPDALLVMRITFGPVAALRLRWVLQATSIGTQLSVTVAIGGLAAGLLLKKGAQRIAAAMPANLERLAAVCAAGVNA